MPPRRSKSRSGSSPTRLKSRGQVASPSSARRRNSLTWQEFVSAESGPGVTMQDISRLYQQHKQQEHASVVGHGPDVVLPNCSFSSPRGGSRANQDTAAHKKIVCLKRMAETLQDAANEARDMTVDQRDVCLRNAAGAAAEQAMSDSPDLNRMLKTRDYLARC
jgi:hypothetical protein